MRSGWRASWRELAFVGDDRVIIAAQPAVTHANVGELALDVLVATLQPEYLGPLEDANILPCVGNDAFDPATPGTLSTALELFRVPGEQSSQGCSSVQRGESVVLGVGEGRGGGGRGASRSPLVSAGGRLKRPRVLPTLRRASAMVATTPGDSCPPHAAAGTQLYFLQQRAPAARGRQQAFADQLAAWAAAAGAAQVVVLAGLDAQLRRDRQIEGSPVR